MAVGDAAVFDRAGWRQCRLGSCATATLYHLDRGAVARDHLRCGALHRWRCPDRDRNAGACLLLAGDGWPHERCAFRRVAAITIAGGVGYTVFSEWLNTTVRKSWAYSELMPIVPGLEIGLSPLAQWIVMPLLGFWWARRTCPRVRSAEVETLNW